MSEHNKGGYSVVCDVQLIDGKIVRSNFRVVNAADYEPWMSPSPAPATERVVTRTLTQGTIVHDIPC